MSEQRLIDANALQEKLKRYFGVKDGVLLRADAYAVLSAIDEAETIAVIKNTSEVGKSETDGMEVMPYDSTAE